MASTTKPQLGAQSLALQRQVFRPPKFSLLVCLPCLLLCSFSDSTGSCPCFSDQASFIFCVDMFSDPCGGGDEVTFWWCEDVTWWICRGFVLEVAWLCRWCWVVVMCDADLCPFLAVEGVSAVGGWFSWSVGGDGVVGSGDRRVVWRGDV